MQLVHLREIARVLRPGGVGYLASPTRWALVEPHFKLPLLSWLPHGARDRALRLSRRGSVYDISPRTRPELLRLIGQAGLRATDATVDALRAAAEIEAGAASRAAAALPGGVLTAARGAVPTMVFVLEH